MKFYIDGRWVRAERPGREIPVVNPASEQVIGRVALGDAQDVDRAIRAAKQSFENYSQTGVEARIALFDRVIARYEDRLEDLGRAISAEMGAPLHFAIRVQADLGLQHLRVARRLLSELSFEERRGSTWVRRAAIGVCALITPWNWPANQICCKVGPALAAGCTVVLKPSELAPLSSQVITEILESAGVPPGVFNLVHGYGPEVGAALCSHPDVDMVSFTGSTRAGAEVARVAASTVKRVTQELGGRSAGLFLEDADLETAVRSGVTSLVSNAGQSCNAQSRWLVAESRYDEVLERVVAAADAVTVGDPSDPATQMGPIANQSQFHELQRRIRAGIDEGARLIAGGAERPASFSRGYYLRPTVFADVRNEMALAREEIFGPVLVVIPFRDDDDAVRMANDSLYGLSGRVWSRDVRRARGVAARLRTGMVHVNSASVQVDAPFGGFKRSGNGREWGREGLEQYLEIQSVFGGVD